MKGEPGTYRIAIEPCDEGRRVTWALVNSAGSQVCVSSTGYLTHASARAGARRACLAFQTAMRSGVPREPAEDFCDGYATGYAEAMRAVVPADVAACLGAPQEQK